MILSYGISINVNQQLESLNQSRFRVRFRLDEKDRAYIEKSGLPKIKEHAYDFIEKRLAPAQPKNDGKQTPFRGHPVFKAQHATATCCPSATLQRKLNINQSARTALILINENKLEIRTVLASHLFKIMKASAVMTSDEHTIGYLMESHGCRGCLSKWHHIEKGRELTQKEMDYVVQVILQWIVQ